MPRDFSDPSRTHMPLPKRYDLAFYLLFYPFILLTVVVSIGYLVLWDGIPVLTLIAGVLWTGFVSLFVVTSIREENGLRQYFVNRLGSLSRSQFVSVLKINGSKTVRFGFDLFGREWSYADIPAAAIVSLDFHSGQATALAGKDMHDWHVTLWYRDPITAETWEGIGARTDELYIIGSPDGRKETTEAFTQDLIQFLQQSGVELRRSERENEFVPV